MAVAKLLVCVCTCFVGGTIWGFIDLIAVVINALGRRNTIDTMGMQAEFDDSEIQPCFILGILAIVFNVLFICCGTGLARAVLRRLREKRRRQREGLEPSDSEYAQ